MRKDMAVVFLFMLLFVFSSFPRTTTAVRFSIESRNYQSGNLMSIGDENDSTQQLNDADFQKKGRMDIETSDYQTGPNPKHNPPPTPAPGPSPIPRKSPPRKRKPPSGSRKQRAAHGPSTRS
ncbi:hypothetical protein OROMI_002936 [Orobanche minor]